MSQWNLHVGDCLSSLRGMEGGAVQTCVTSPPYFGLRDYGVPGQIGLEPTPDEFVGRLVEVFREVRRVLRDDGTLWLNLGDSYAGYHGNKNAIVPTSATNGWTNGTNENMRGDQRPQDIGLKPKDLIGIPWRVAFALQADGWYLRQDIIWHKPNPMPESVRDRCTKAHEYIFLLAKSERYYFDSEAMQEPAVCGAKGSEFHTGKTGDHQLGRASKQPRFGGAKYGDSSDPKHATKSGNEYQPTGTRNKRSVWTVSTKPFKGAHFATFPPDLIEPCVLAGAPEGGLVLDPFTGSGTTGMVAVKHGRRFVGCELNPEYAAMAEGRIGGAASAHALFGGAA
jgi:DNA modification methylase